MPVFHDVELESPFSPSVPGWLAEEYAVVDSGAATQSIKVPK